jgi:aspartate-semialdehyde dehydrogenase
MPSQASVLHQNERLRVAVVGATGAVGQEIVKCLERRDFPVGELHLLASARSAGMTIDFRGRPHLVAELRYDTLNNLDLVLFAAGNRVSLEFAPVAVRAGAMVVDLSSAHRMQPDVPLVVPEINAAAIRGHKGIIANPNCSAIIAITPLWPLHRENRIRRIFVSTYQAASGGGAAAMTELLEATRASLDGVPYPPRVLPHSYGFNLFSHNSAVDPKSGYNGEELKIIQETRKIFDEPELRVGATCVRVPVLRAHSISVNVEFQHRIDLDEVRRILKSAPGVCVVDDWKNNLFPMPRDATGRFEILVGRIRGDVSDPSGRSLCLFSAGDQLLKGAALNAIQIAEVWRRDQETAARSRQ